MGHIRKNLFRILFAFQILAIFIPTPSQAIDSRDDAGRPVASELPGKIMKMFVETGQLVKKGTLLCDMEVMKMHFSIVAPFSGKISSVFFKERDYVEKGTPLMTLLPPESASASSSPSPSHTLPSSQGKNDRALSILQDENDQQAPEPSNVFLPSLSKFLEKRPDPFSGSPASVIVPDSLLSPSLALPVIPGAIPPSLPSPSVGYEPAKSNFSATQGNATGTVGGKPSAHPIRPTQLQEISVPSDKMEKPSFKKDGEKGTVHSLNKFPNGFLQRLPQESFKPALFGDTGYSIMVACTKWTAGLVALACFLFTLKTMACSLLINPLSRAMHLRAMDFNKQGLTAISNRNRIGRRRIQKRKVA